MVELPDPDAKRTSLEFTAGKRDRRTAPAPAPLTANTTGEIIILFRNCRITTNKALPLVWYEFAVCDFGLLEESAFYHRGFGFWIETPNQNPFTREARRN